MTGDTLGVFQPEDLYELSSPGEPQFSPDGSTLLHVVARADRVSDGYRADLFLHPLGGQTVRRLVAGRGRLRRPTFSPAGDRVAYIDLGDSGAAQLWLVDITTGRTEQLTKAGEVSDLCWSPDGSQLAFCALAPGIEPRSAKIREFTQIPTTADGLGVLEPEGPGLYILDLRTRASHLVAGGPYTYRAPAWSPDGSQLAVARVVHYALAVARGGELVVMSGSGEGARVFATDMNWQQPPALAWAPDSSRLAYCTADLHQAGRPARIVQVNLSGGRSSTLSERHDRFPCQGVVADTRPGAGAAGIGYSMDGDWLYYVAGDRGSVPLFRCATDGSGTWEQVSPKGPHSVAEFALAPDGKIAYVSQTDTDPDQIWVLDSGAPPIRITDVAREFWASSARAPMERFTVRPEDGPEAEAWIQFPRGSSRASLPAVLSIHGGPHGMFGYCMTLDVQGWLDSGLAVIQVNPPGSAGYGFDFARAIWGDWGGKDFRYQIAALDHCVSQGWIDPERLALTGTSYGGYMVNLMIARTDRFRCAVSENGLSDMISVFGTTDFGPLYDRPHVGGVPWREPEKYLALSPLRYAADVTTPILLLAAEEDHRQPIGQSEEWFTALIIEGKTAVLVRYPHDSHFMRLHGRPSNRVHRLRRVRSWFAQHVGSTSPAGGDLAG